VLEGAIILLTYLVTYSPT